MVRSVTTSFYNFYEHPVYVAVTLLSIKLAKKLSKLCAFRREAQRISKKGLSLVQNGPLT